MTRLRNGVWIMMTIHTLCHCEEGTKVTDAAIHRVPGEADDLSLRLLAHSGSPRAYALAMTRVVENDGEQTFKKLRFFFFWRATAFPVPHKENTGIALTIIEGKNRIDAGYNISTQKNTH